MNDSIVKFLLDNPARISNGNTWLVVNKIGKDIFYTVYSRSYGQRKNRTLYDGVYLETALMFLKGED